MLDRRFYAVILIFLSVSACSPTGSNPTQVTMSDLVGLWDSSENTGVKKDVIYTRVTSEGAIIEYDYDGDEIDDGLACYHVDTGSLKNIEANRFLVATDMHADKQFVIELELLDAGNALKVYFLDENDPAKTVKSQIWTRVTDESLLTDEPTCGGR
ncbi:MAG: hypothetical protein KAT12_03665 [Gammaproteobacteria bacterium]|nr:hypothetical protein [Gammaproteobacteria bacterium]